MLTYLNNNAEGVFDGTSFKCPSFKTTQYSTPLTTFLFNISPSLMTSLYPYPLPSFSFPILLLLLLKNISTQLDQSNFILPTFALQSGTPFFDISPMKATAQMAYPPHTMQQVRSRSSFFNCLSLLSKFKGHICVLGRSYLTRYFRIPDSTMRRSLKKEFKIHRIMLKIVMNVVRKNVIFLRELAPLKWASLNTVFV